MSVSIITIIFSGMLQQMLWKSHFKQPVLCSGNIFLRQIYRHN
jgi:hypothetical protein